MSTKHTPGPWIAKEQYRDSVTNDVGHFVMRQDRSKPGVMLRRLDDKKGAFSAADARLIAAAPEMLDLLERMHDAEKTLTKEQRDDYVERLSPTGTSRCPYSSFTVLHATASQRAEAFLRVIGKWVDA